MLKRVPTDDKPQVSSSNNTKLHYAWIVALTGSLAIFCGLGLGRFTFGMLLPSMSASLGLDHSQGGLLGLSNMTGYLVAVIISPFVLSLLGTRITIASSLVLISATMIGMTLTTNFSLLCALYLITGIGSGGVVMPIMSVMSKWFTPSRRGIALGVVMSGPGLGIILSGFVVPKLEPVFSLLSWQTGWLIFALINIFVAIIAYKLMRNHPSEVGQHPFGRRADTSPPIASKISIKANEKPQSNKVKLLAHLGLMFAIYGATYMVYITFIVTTMIDSYKLTEASAGSLWAWFGFLSIFSGIIFGWISDKAGRHIGLASAFITLAVAYFLVGLTDSMLGLYLSIILFGLAAWSVPVIMGASAGDFFATASATNALAILTLAFSGGQALGPLTASYIAEITNSFSISYTSSGIAAILAVGLALLLRPQQANDH
ncbi:YbfB/YjiJ family MFS transporter [Pseudocolwellia sp. HL-MZ19]|uniref:YbfB/YjiJ family MFS transporter n=1 Tax=unclassified Pseudocolwellia TaxID=2848178 RepID=UPI003CF8D1ED